jgi:hypothetical protein
MAEVLSSNLSEPITVFAKLCFYKVLSGEDIPDEAIDESGDVSRVFMQAIVYFP